MSGYQWATLVISACVAVGTISMAILIFISICQNKKNLELIRSRALEARISKVVSEYIILDRSLYDSGLTGLCKAGIGELENGEEMKEAIQRISMKVINHPLGRDKNILQTEPKALKIFFVYFCQGQLDNMSPTRAIQKIEEGEII